MRAKSERERLHCTGSLGINIKDVAACSKSNAAVLNVVLEM